MQFGEGASFALQPSSRWLFKGVHLVFRSLPVFSAGGSSATASVSIQDSMLGSYVCSGAESPLLMAATALGTSEFDQARHHCTCIPQCHIAPLSMHRLAIQCQVCCCEHVVRCTALVALASAAQLGAFQRTASIVPQSRLARQLACMCNMMCLPISVPARG